MHDDDGKLEENSTESKENEGTESISPGSSNDEQGREDLLDAEGGPRSSSASSVERHRSVDPERHEQDPEIVGPDYQNQDGNSVGHYVVERNAPLPTVDEFRGYEHVLPGAADRILKMAETSMEASRESTSADAEVQKSIAYSVWSSAKIAERQQWIFAIIALVALVGSFILGWNDKDIPSMVGIIVAVGSGWMSFQAFKGGQKITPNSAEGGS